MDERATGRACGACGAADPATVAFCSSCGASLHPVCPTCGAQVTESSVFCGACGMGDPLDDVELQERFVTQPGVAAMLDSV